MLLDKFSLSQFHPIITAAMHHFIAVFLCFCNEDFVQLHLYFGCNAARHIRVGLLFCFVNWNPRQFLTERVIILNMFIFGYVFENETENVSKLLSALYLHITANMFCLLLQLPLKTCPLFPAFIYCESHRVHVQVYG